MKTRLKSLSAPQLRNKNYNITKWQLRQHYQHSSIASTAALPVCQEGSAMLAATEAMRWLTLDYKTTRQQDDKTDKIMGL